MRCDVNISVRLKGRETLGTKVEIKNMNSFSAMQKAIEFEMDRQVRREVLCLIPKLLKQSIDRETACFCGICVPDGTNRIPLLHLQ